MKDRFQNMFKGIRVGMLTGLVLGFIIILLSGSQRTWLDILFTLGGSLLLGFVSGIIIGGVFSTKIVGAKKGMVIGTLAGVMNIAPIFVVDGITAVAPAIGGILFWAIVGAIVGKFSA